MKSLLVSLCCKLHDQPLLLYKEGLVPSQLRLEIDIRDTLLKLRENCENFVFSYTLSYLECIWFSQVAALAHLSWSLHHPSDVITKRILHLHKFFSPSSSNSFPKLYEMLNMS